MRLRNSRKTTQRLSFVFVAVAALLAGPAALASQPAPQAGRSPVPAPVHPPLDVDRDPVPSPDPDTATPAATPDQNAPALGPIGRSNGRYTLREDAYEVH